MPHSFSFTGFICLALVLGDALLLNTTSNQKLVLLLREMIILFSLSAVLASKTGFATSKYRFVRLLVSFQTDMT